MQSTKSGWQGKQNTEVMENLLTIDDIARQTGLEESLLRFYESEYAEELPNKILRGDTLFFEKESVAEIRRLHSDRTYRSAYSHRCEHRPLCRQAQS